MSEMGLSVEGLTIALGRSFRIEDLSLEVGAGETVALVGPNGSGKSSVLRTIAGLEVPQAGRISWSGTLLSSAGRVHVPPEDRKIGMLLEDSALFPHLDVRANVALALPRAATAAERDDLVNRALELARVLPLRARPVTTLSSGEQQRVALARALVRGPGLLLLDEPFHSLDGPTKRGILADLKAVVRDRKLAVIDVTHDPAEASDLSDRVVLLRHGRKQQEGTFEDLYAHPRSPFVADFFGPVQTIEAEAARRDGIELPAEASEGRISFRPECLLLSPCSDAARARLVVEQVRGAGALVRITVRLTDGSSLEIGRAHV